MVHPAALRELLVLPAGPRASPCSSRAPTELQPTPSPPSPGLPLLAPGFKPVPPASSVLVATQEGPQGAVPRAGCPSLPSTGSPNLPHPKPSHCASFRPSSDGPDPTLGSPPSLCIPQQACSGPPAPPAPRSAHAGPRRATAERCPGWHSRLATRIPSPPTRGALLGFMGLAPPYKGDISLSTEPHAGGG